MFRIQVQVWEAKINHWAWRDIRPSGGQPYEFAEREEAERTLRICYPDGMAVTRVATPEMVESSRILSSDDPRDAERLDQCIKDARVCMNSRQTQLPCDCLCCTVFKDWHGIRSK